MSSVRKSRKERIEIHEGWKASVEEVAKWDMSQWHHWTVIGRVLPERCNVMLGPTTTALVGSNGRALLRIHIASSHISVKCLVERADSSVFQISDMVKNALASMVDYISFMNRGYYDVILDTCISDASGEANLIPISEPIFEPPRLGSLFSFGRRHDGGVPLGTINNESLATALHDLSQAARYTPRTMEYCRMALEAVRHHFELNRP